MDAYIYRAALWCTQCTEQLKRHDERPAWVNEDDESSYDSDEWPKGPYADGGGEADCPQHCDHCGAFLENPLTADGYAYVVELIDDFLRDDRGNVAALRRQWAEFYDLEFWCAGWNMPGYLPDSPYAVFVCGPNDCETVDGKPMPTAEKAAREYIADELRRAADAQPAFMTALHKHAGRLADSIADGSEDSAEFDGYHYEVSPLPIADALPLEEPDVGRANASTSPG